METDIRNSLATNGGDWLERFGELWKKHIETLQGKFGSKIEKVLMPSQCPTDVPIVFVQKNSILEVLEFMKQPEGMDYHFLADITATDELPEQPRFHVVYQLFSHSTKCRIRLKVRVSENESVPSATSIWKAANWAEREVWDMFGIKFDGHPDLRRILMDERWEGHPLRKDYPRRGYQIFPTAQDVKPELLQD